MGSIKRVASKYGIDPIHIVGAIVGEHTYNYDTLDSAQSYYVKALSYAGIRFDFELNGEHVDTFIERPQFDRCRKEHIQKSSDRRWSCYENVWNSKFRGRKVDGVRYPKKNFNEAFFQPLFSGQSFGLGQLSPLTVLKMTDRVARQSSYPQAGSFQSQGKSTRRRWIRTSRCTTWPRSFRIRHFRLQVGRQGRHFQQSRPDRHALQSR